MNSIKGTFIGTGAALTICLGFRPTKVTVRNIAAADSAHIIWHKELESLAALCDGVKYRENTGVQQTNLTVGTGIRQYAGGVRNASAVASIIMPVSGITALQGTLQGNAKTWTLQTAGNRTGKFNAGIDTALVGAGSRILIAPSDPAFGNVVETSIVAITNDGDADNEITLSREVPSGRILSISYKYGFGTAPAGLILPEGIVLAETADVNVAGELCLIEAEH